MPSPSSRHPPLNDSQSSPIQSGQPLQAGPSSPQGQGYGSKTWISVASPKGSSPSHRPQLGIRDGSGNSSGSGSVSPNGKERQGQKSSYFSNGSNGSRRVMEGNNSNQPTAGPSRIPVESLESNRMNDSSKQARPGPSSPAAERLNSSTNLHQNHPASSYSGLPSSNSSNLASNNQRHQREDSAQSVSSGPKPPPLISRHYGLDPTLRGKASTAVPEDPNSLSNSTSFGYAGSELSASSPSSPDGEQPKSKKEREKREKEREKEMAGTPLFSVEIKANRFDSRGWPVFSGTAPLIRGNIRMPADIGCEVALTLAAHTTLGAPAASWQNVALIPYEDGSEKKVFSVTDRFQPNFDLVSARPPTPDQATRKDWPRHEDYILEIPFDVNLPMGCATRIVDGKLESAHVPLPPSFEISSEGNAKERERQRRLKAIAKQQAKEEKLNNNNNGEISPTGQSLFPLSRSTSNTNNFNSNSTVSGSTVTGSSTTGASTSAGSSILGISLGKSKSRSRDGREGVASNAAAAFRDAVERGFEQVYRIGCYYHMTFQLQRNAKKSEAGTILRIPFLFLGETFVPPNPAPSLPMQISLPPAFLMQQAAGINAANAPSASPLGRGWTSIKASSKWSGSGWKSLRRGVEVELHTPSNTVFAPSAVPFLLVLRPNDTAMFNNVPSSPGFAPGQNQVGQGFGSPSHSDYQSPPDSPRLNFSSNMDQNQSQNQSRPASSAGSAVARWMRGSLTLSRLPSNANNNNNNNNNSPIERGQQGSSPKSTSGGRNRTTSDAARPLTSSSGRRPSTAPSVWNSSESPPTTAGGDKLGNLNPSASHTGNSSSRGPFGLGSLASASASVLNFGRNGGTTERHSDNSGGTTALPSNAQGYQHCLSDLIRVSLIQATYCVSASVNEAPEKRKRLISLADLEEVDIASLSTGTGGEGHQDRQNLSMDEQIREEERVMAASVAAKSSGVRILRGLLKVGSDTTPGFRSQGLEVKYAIKVDLLPNSSNTSSLTSAFKTLSTSKSGGASTSGSSVYTSSPNARSRARGLSDGMSSSGTNTTHPSPAFLAQTISNASPPTTPPTLSDFNSSSNSSQDDATKRSDQIGIAYSTNEDLSTQRQASTTPTQNLMGMSSPPNQSQSSSSNQLYSHSQYNPTSIGSPSLSSARSPSELPGSSQIGSPSHESTSKLSKSVGALWVDVRLVRAAIV